MLYVNNESTTYGNDTVSLSFDAVQEATCTDFMEGTLEALAENEANWNALLESAGINELNYYLQTGKEMPYNEAAGQGFFESAKAWFKKAWEKIQSLFKRFFAMFTKMVMNDKDFAKKYEKDLITVDTKDFEYKGFKFNLEAVDVEKAASAISTSTAYGDNYDYQEWLEGEMGKVVGGSSLTRKEFAKELFSKLRSGEDKKETLDGEWVKPAKLLQYLRGSEKSKTTAEKNYKRLKKEVEDSIRTTTTAQKAAVNAAVKDNSDAKVTEADEAAKKISEFKGKLEILQLVNGACLNAYKSCSSQTKSICVKLLGYKGKKEDTDMGSYAEGANFATPTFI